ncbi:phosphoesterase RecJ domain-containing protein [Halosimplex carlsbadense 2-9-1]|uniref:Phosphoesterase RecJ domain-containing protein n=1 Tax=Halosimplex carlsbadense 2-9-1 TaxID=797114 RepID=M0D121_9EURY|nr:DHH family phosphoesterase [Halosimplex carlsbadense]ELZ29140.1 phosphoesterase RecJ domain-containing protein [Halosimplex carlsbadense 2-9-1]
MSTTGPVPDLAGRASACADRLLESDAVLLASHIDADGLTSAAVASTALERAGLAFETVFKKQLDETEIATIAAREYDTVLFTDFGSGQLDAIAAHERAGDFDPVIADHHQPADAETEFHLNPLLEGIDGASELSGAGAAYVLARALEERGGQSTGNRDLAALAVVGAVGDMQAVGGELVGANRGIVEEGVEAGVLAEGTDLSLYGKQTRPLPKLFEYATEVQIPGVSGDEAGSVRFLEGLDVDLKEAGEWRTWVDLSDGERQTVASALVKHAVQRGVPAKKINTLVGTTYELVDEPRGTELRDASEFSTLLNATARYERADVGLGVCLGNREGALDRAQTLLSNHRRNLSEGLEYVRREGVTHEDHLQWFDAGDAIRETIVGIVAGMALGTDGVSASKPIVALARKNEEETKVSARGTGTLVREGLDLSAVMGEASRSVGGDGGGHDIAAGATVPAGTEQAFVDAADDIVADQTG